MNRVLRNQLAGDVLSSVAYRLRMYIYICTYIYIYVCTYIYVHTHTHTHIYIYIEGVSRLVEITAGGDFLGLCDQKSSYQHVSDFGRLRGYDRLKLRIKGNGY